LAYLDELGVRPSKLKKICIGGSALPLSMARTFLTQYGIEVTHAWGMTEMSPVGVVSTPTPALDLLPEEDRRQMLWTRQGRLQFGVELRVVDENGRERPSDGRTPGFVQVRGPWVIKRYFGEMTDAIDLDGWFDTGDVGTLDANGFLRLTDRSKDL